jgi:hypothetical protein
MISAASGLSSSSRSKRAPQLASRVGREKVRSLTDHIAGIEIEVGAYRAQAERRIEVNIHVTKQPEHGTVETTTATNFPSYSKEHIRYKCNQHKVRGMQVHYKSAEKYVGDDALDLLVLLPTPAQL